MRPSYCLIGLLCVGVAFAYDEPETKSKYDEPEPEYKSSDYSDKTPDYPTPEYPTPEYPTPEYPTPDYPTPEYPTLKYHTSYSRPYNPNPAPFLYSFNRAGASYFNNQYPRIPSPYPGIPFNNLLRGAANGHAYVPTPVSYMPEPAPYEPTPNPYEHKSDSYEPKSDSYESKSDSYEPKSDSYEPKSDSYEPDLVPTYYDAPRPTPYYPSMHYSVGPSSYPAYPSYS